MRNFSKFISAFFVLSVFSVVGFAQQTTVVKNDDGSYTVIEYPLGKEVVVNLIPGSTMVNAKGLARVMRADDGTKIYMDLTSIAGDSAEVYAYTVDPAGVSTLLGPIALTSGTGKAEFVTEMDKFMLVLSPNKDVTVWETSTPVIFRSEVPQGFAVVPVVKTGETQAVAAGATVSSTYQVPLLGVPSFGGKTTEIRIKFSGELDGLKGKAYVDPGATGTTQIKMRFDDMKMAPKGKRFVLWASSPTGEYTKLGQVINTGERQESEIRSETALPDFGLFVTIEETDVLQPSSKVYSVFGQL